MIRFHSQIILNKIKYISTMNQFQTSYLKIFIIVPFQKYIIKFNIK